MNNKQLGKMKIPNNALNAQTLLIIVIIAKIKAYAKDANKDIF